MAALHQLGPEYQSPLIATESSGLLDQHPSAAAALSLGAGTAAAAAAAAASPQGLPPRLLLAFCPQLTASAAAEDSSSAASGGGRRVGRAIRDAVAGLPAALLTGAQLCRTRQPGDMLHCLGGIAVLLPLLEQGPPPDSEGSGGGSDGTAAAVLRLLAAMLRGNAGNQQGMEELGGEAVLLNGAIRARVQCSAPACLSRFRVSGFPVPSPQILSTCLLRAATCRLLHDAATCKHHVHWLPHVCCRVCPHSPPAGAAAAAARHGAPGGAAAAAGGGRRLADPQPGRARVSGAWWRGGRGGARCCSAVLASCRAGLQTATVPPEGPSGLRPGWLFPSPAVSPIHALTPYTAVQRCKCVRRRC